VAAAEAQVGDGAGDHPLESHRQQHGHARGGGARAQRDRGVGPGRRCRSDRSYTIRRVPRCSPSWVTARTSMSQRPAEGVAGSRSVNWGGGSVWRR